MDKANEYQHEWNSTGGAGEVEPSDRTFLAQDSLLGSIPASFGAKRNFNNYICTKTKSMAVFVQS